MKSTLLNMVAVLFCITLISSAGVGLVNMITVDPIAEAKAKAVNDAVLAVLPEFDEKQSTELEIDAMPIKEEGSVTSLTLKFANALSPIQITGSSPCVPSL